VHVMMMKEVYTFLNYKTFIRPKSHYLG
jgi:hypothetical protein